MNKSSKIAVIGILSAAVAGAVVGLLFTQKGKEITNKGKEKASEYKDQLVELWKKTRKEAKESTNGQNPKAEELIA